MKRDGTAYAGYNPIPQAVPYEKGLFTYQAEAVDPQLFVIVGSEFSEVVEIGVPPGQILSAEPGTMVHMSKLIRPYVDMGSCSQGCIRCCCAGESCCRLNFHNNTNEKQVLAFSGNLVG